MLKFFVVLSIFGSVLNDDEVCTAETCQESTQNLYTAEQNQLIDKIKSALDTYTPCIENVTCSCFLPAIKKDLKPFKDGIVKDMLDAVRDRGTKYQIINHKLYREQDCMFPARCSGVEHYIKPHLDKLPDMEFLLNCRDWPQINTKWGMPASPVFSFSKTPDYLDIMYPAWAFWEGGPAISLYPTGLGKWDEHRESITAATEKWPWTRKHSKAFFRGSRTSDERDPLVMLGRELPALFDAQYTKNQAWKSAADTLGAEPATEVKLEDHCRYKFLFNYRGVAASFRFKHLFLCKSLVFHVGDEYKEFFYEFMQPWVHYVPVPAKATKDDIKNLIQFFMENDDLAQRIAEEGHKFIWEKLTTKVISCYWKRLLKRYAKLLKFEVKLDDNLIPIY